MGSIPVGSTKKQTQMCLLLLSRLEIERRRSVVPIPERSACSLLYGSTKKQTHLCLLLLSLRRIERLLTQPDSRTLGRLSDIREYQTTVKTAFLYDEEKGLTIQNAQRIFGNKF